MSNNAVTPELSPIIVIDDDQEDLDLMCEAFREINPLHPLLCFDKPQKALEYLMAPGATPHFTISDVHMQLMDAYALRAEMLKNPVPANQRPFFIISSVITDREIAYLPDLQIHHYFIKAFRYEDLLANCHKMLLAAAM